jgi:type II secretory pathway pseudopilin PulG
MNYKNKAQVWVETAIYSLIGLTIIAILLTAAMPQIDKMKDKAIVTQTTTALNELDSQIADIQQAPGNIRIVYFKLSKGTLTIDPQEEKIIYLLENTNLELSEPGLEIKEGNIILRTEEHGRNFNVFLTLDYSEKFDMSLRGNNIKNQILQSGSTDYQIKVESTQTGIDFDIL